MEFSSSPFQWILSFLLLASSLGVVLARKPIYASLSFLLSLLILAMFYLELSAEFIAVMQILVYAGAIMVIFIFVMILFQNAWGQIELHSPASNPLLISISVISFAVALLIFKKNIGQIWTKQTVPLEFGSAESLGKMLYIDFFFPFEAIVLLFLVAAVGAIYIAKRGD